MLLKKTVLITKKSNKTEIAGKNPSQAQSSQ
jgi:hypothetical protein